MKYIGVTLTKKVKDLYDKNLKPLKKEIEEDLRKMERNPMLMGWKDQHFKNCYPSNSNLQIQRNPHKNFNPVIH